MEKKEVTMKKAEKPTKEKLTYEELENVCHQLSEQARTLYQKLQDAEMTNLFKRLDYLFAVVENSKEFPSEFTTKCVKEIMSAMTIPEKSEEETKTEE